MAYIHVEGHSIHTYVHVEGHSILRIHTYMYVCRNTCFPFTYELDLCGNGRYRGVAQACLSTIASCKQQTPPLLRSQRREDSGANAAPVYARDTHNNHSTQNNLYHYDNGPSSTLNGSWTAPIGSCLKPFFGCVSNSVCSISESENTGMLLLHRILTDICAS